MCTAAGLTGRRNGNARIGRVACTRSDRGADEDVHAFAGVVGTDVITAAPPSGEWGSAWLQRCGPAALTGLGVSVSRDASATVPARALLDRLGELVAVLTVLLAVAVAIAAVTLAKIAGG
ncbi:hypothetical protein HZU40_03855 [Mycolicibacterium fluoranthenivorans]|uniref:Uncharacterized protein n=1 Tax=Mycolicibacterium fluoranthenivorans TaxID=258505 RepID=A0A7G8PGM5_9MYCO|nr:hypothetical protein [Mycolicibacterium fluoranthenivorans]QNJ93491.1 hypothetical protein HZU40_03855 [Mycolicibacterium fluoranthenivorans]